MASPCSFLGLAEYLATVEHYEVYPPGVHFINASLDFGGVLFYLGGGQYAGYGDM